VFFFLSIKRKWDGRHILTDSQTTNVLLKNVFLTFSRLDRMRSYLNLDSLRCYNTCTLEHGGKKNKKRTESNYSCCALLIRERSEFSSSKRPRRISPKTPAVILVRIQWKGTRKDVRSLLTKPLCLLFKRTEEGKKKERKKGHWAFGRRKRGILPHTDNLSGISHIATQSGYLFTSQENNAQRTGPQKEGI